MKHLKKKTLKLGTFLITQLNITLNMFISSLEIVPAEPLTTSYLSQERESDKLKPKII